MPTPYHATTAIPPLVRQAQALAQLSGFTQSCTDEVGRLLRLLASQTGVRGGIVGEIGTGCGVGTAWLVSGLARDASLITIEYDAARAEATRSVFSGHSNVTVLVGDWRDLVAHGPFALLFADGGKAKEEGADDVRRALAPGGMVVLDDLTPEHLWPAEWRGRPDPVREYWPNHPELVAAELLTTPSSCVILATAMPLANE